MCEPTTIALIGLAISGAAAGSSFYGQTKAAHQAKNADAKYFEANKRAAIDAATLNSREIGLRQSEEILASATQMQDESLEEEAILSIARTSSAEAGITGHSVDAVLNDIRMQKSKERVRIGTNLDLTQDQMQREKEAILVDARNSINTVRQTKVNGPSMVTPVLQVAGDALQTYEYIRSRPQAPPTPKTADVNWAAYDATALPRK